MTLVEVARETGLANSTIKGYINAELPGVKLKDGRIEVDSDFYTEGSDIRTGRTGRYLRPAISESNQKLRRTQEEGYIEIRTSRANLGSPRSVKRFLDTLDLMNDMTDEGNEEILRRIDKEGSAGSGERIA